MEAAAGSDPTWQPVPISSGPAPETQKVMSSGRASAPSERAQRDACTIKISAAERSSDLLDARGPLLERGRMATRYWKGIEVLLGLLWK